jgi:hypothetical protein
MKSQTFAETTSARRYRLLGWKEKSAGEIGWNGFG